MLSKNSLVRWEGQYQVRRAGSDEISRWEGQCQVRMAGLGLKGNVK